MAAVPFIGSRISLISRSDIRYEGILVHIDPQESTVYLSNVRSYGTEDRCPPEKTVPASNETYEYIIFRSSDIKDLTVSEAPAAPQPQPQRTPNDPAIVQPQGLYSPFAGYGQPQTAPQGQYWPQQQNPYGMMMPNPWMYQNSMYQNYAMQQQQYAAALQQQQAAQQAQQPQQAQGAQGAQGAQATAAQQPQQQPSQAQAQPQQPQVQPAQQVPSQPQQPAQQQRQVQQPTAVAAAPAKAVEKPVGGQPKAAAKQPAGRPQQQQQPAASTGPRRDPKNPWGRPVGGQPVATAQPTQQLQQQQQHIQQRPQHQHQYRQQQQRPAQQGSTTVSGQANINSWVQRASQSLRGGHHGHPNRTAHTGRFPQSSKTAPAIPKQPVEANFDFEQFLKKFDKAKFLEDVERDLQKSREEGKVAEMEIPADHAYVKDDFFDHLSGQSSDVDGEAAAKGPQGLRLLQEQRKRDSETFGATAVRNQQYGSHQGGSYYGSVQRGGHHGHHRGGHGGQHHQGGQPQQGASSNTQGATGTSGSARGGHRGGHTSVVGGQRVNPSGQRSSYHHSTNRSYNINQPRGGATGNRGGRSNTGGQQGKVFRPKPSSNQRS